MMGNARRPLMAGLLTLAMSLSTGIANADSPATASPIARLAHGLNPANWTMPSFGDLMPGQEDKTRIVKKKDSLFEDMSQTAAKSWAKTKQTFDPRKLNPMNLFPAQPVRPTPKSGESPGFFGSLFGGDSRTATRPSGTVNEFLGQPKINR